jgi:sortase A
VTVLDRPQTAPPGGSGPPPGGAQSDPEPQPAPANAKPPPRRRSAVTQIAWTTVLILSATLIGFALYIGLISSLHHDRAQHNAYATFRKALAEATAPIGQTVITEKPTDPIRLVRPGTPVAVLHIPQIHLREVVFEGTTPAIMQNGPGHLRTTPFPGQAGVSEIMGRAATYGGPFGRLSQLSPGDLFSVTTGQGVNAYRVLDVRHEGDPKPAPLAFGKGRLVLATSDGVPYIPAGVLRVDADLMSPTRPAPPMVLSAANLSGAEHAMGTDPTAWIPLVLWGQGLVVAAALITWARGHWGFWQVWIVAVPVLLYFGLAVADQAARLLPNLM